MRWRPDVGQPFIMTGLEYLFVSQFFSSLMLAVVLFMVWRTVERRPHTLSWSLLFVVATMQYSLNALVGLLALEGTSRDVYWIVVNAMSLCVQGLAWAGFRQRAGLRGWPNYFIGYLVVVEFLVIWFTMVKFHQGLRMALIPWSGTLVLAGCAWILLMPGRRLRPPEWGAAVIFGLYSLSQIAVGAVALMQGAQADEHYLEIYRQINFLAMPAMFVGLGLFTVLIVADDLSDRMRTLALTDQLTGVLNRRGFERSAERAMSLARRMGKPACLVMTDLDRFKSINDSHGHDTGDRAIEAFARTLVAGVRGGDIVGRLGGDEFALLLWTDPASSLETIERLRREVKQTRVEAGDRRLTMTASFGIAPLEPHHRSAFEALNDADQALYEAKRAGRNRAELHPV